MYKGPIWGSMPPGYPTKTAEAEYRRFIQLVGEGTDKRHLMGYGFKGAAYKYKAMVGYGEKIKELIDEEGLTPPADVESELHRFLFGFFVNGESAIESFYFAAHCLGAGIRPKRFSIAYEDLSNVFPHTVTDKYIAEWKKEPISKVLEKVLRSPEFIMLKTIRHVLLHRVDPPKLIRINIGGPTEVTWQVDKAGAKGADEEISHDTIAKWTSWISGALTMLWEGLIGFPP